MCKYWANIMPSRRELARYESNAIFLFEDNRSNVKWVNGRKNPSQYFAREVHSSFVW